MDQPDQMWAWAHEQPTQAPPKVDASQVLAVLVAHNGEQWLPRTLVGLARLEVRPGRLVAVDAGSTDGSRALLDKARSDGLIHHIIDGPPDQGFGASVQLAVEGAADFDAELLWLLHDDSAPTRRCLTELLLGADDEGEEGRRPAIVVPKLLHPKRRNHPDQVSAVGESIAPSGARVPTVERGDIDQHQLEPARVLGASTAGMLITMDAWRELGGFNPEVPLFRDGVELGWRANALGMVVRTWPQASLRHVEAGRVGLRESVLAPDSIQADQAAGMSVAVIHAEKPARTIRRLGAQSVVQAFGYLLGKSPQLAAGQLRAARQVRQNRDALVAAAQQNQSVAAAQPLPEGLLPGPGWGVRRFFDRVAGRISDQYYDLIEEEDDAGLIDELTGDEFAGGRRRTRFLSPPIIGMIVMLVASLVASRHLMRVGLLSGPALLPAPAGLAEAWAAWTQSVPGAVGANAPWLGWMALGSTLAFGQPDWWATLLVLGGPALAAWTAFGFLRPIIGHGWWTPVLAILWGLQLPLLGATGRGSLDIAVLAIVLPLLGSAVRWWTEAPTTGAESLRPPAAIALLVGILVAAMPWAWLIAAGLAAFMFWHRRHLTGALLVALGPLVLVAPWLPRLVTDPGRLLVGVDPATRAAGTAPNGFEVLTGAAQFPGTPVLLGLLGVGLLLVVGVLGGMRATGIPDRARFPLLGCAVVLPVLAVLVTRFVVDAAGVGVRPDPTGWLLIGLFALLVLAGEGIGKRPERTVDDSPEDLAERAAVIRSRTVLGAIAAVAAAAGALWWIIGATAPLSRQTEVLPSYVTGVQQSDRATRTLMVDLRAGTAHFNVTAASYPQWGSGEAAILSTSEQATDDLWQAAQQFAQGQPSDDMAQRLASLGIAHVWLRGASTEAVTNLSSAPQLGMAPADEETVVFTVTTQPSRAMLRVPGSISDQPILESNVPAVPDGAIVLSEPADSDWHAEIDGVALSATDSDDWRQAWSTDGRGGTLSYRLDADVLAVGWQTVALLVLLVLLAPTAQRSAGPRRALSTQSGRNRGSR